MSEHYFASSSKPVPVKTANKRDRIAREVGGSKCGYTSANMPDGPRSWGYCPNRGEPFDSATAREIMDAWERSGVGV
jgi:hypothetical protein